jgi:hypothetical protein
VRCRQLKLLNGMTLAYFGISMSYFGLERDEYVDEMLFPVLNISESSDKCQRILEGRVHIMPH